MSKRILDVAISLAMIILLAPVLACVALSIRLKLGSPVLFRQPRPGRHGVIFNMLKFRTMSNAVDASGIPLPDAQRLSRFGQFIRSTSLDELPELFNVLKGEMSLVGPRPLFVKYLSLYSAEQARRHHVRPGITGLAQVSGRNDLAWPTRFELDVWYVDNHTLALDIKILLLTVWRVARRESINPDGQMETPHFAGEQAS